ISGEWNFGRFFASSYGKIAVGPMHETVTIAGNMTVSDTIGGTTTAKGGILSTAGDVGTHQRDRIGLVPEGYLCAGVYLFPWLKAYVGYDWMYIQAVVR